MRMLPQLSVTSWTPCSFMSWTFCRFAKTSWQRMTGCWKLNCFLGPKGLKHKDLISVENSSSFLKITFFRSKQFPLVIYFIFAEEKSEQIYLLAKTPFLFRNENRRLDIYLFKFIFPHINFNPFLPTFVINWEFLRKQKQQQKLKNQEIDKNKTKQNKQIF